MGVIKFDGSLNIPTLMSILGAIATALGIFFSVRGDVKLHTAQITQLTLEVGELRRLALHVNNRQDLQEVVVGKVAKAAETNKKQIQSNTAVIKTALPELKALKVKVEEVKPN